MSARDDLLEALTLLGAHEKAARVLVDNHTHEMTETLRDRFAMAALTGLLANEDAVQRANRACSDSESDMEPSELIVALAYRHADAALKQRGAS